MRIRFGGERSDWSVGYALDGDTALVGEELTRWARETVASPYARELLAKVGGCFAAVLHDGTTLDVVSDRFGSRPLYCTGTEVSDDFWQLARDHGRGPHLPAALELLAFGYALGNHTLVEGVTEHPGATWTRVTASGTVDTRYWVHDIVPTKRSRRRLVTELQEQLHGMGARHAALADLLGMDTIGVNLTAGRDSRLLAHLLTRAGSDIRTFTSSNGHSNDATAAAAIADVIGCPHTVLPLWSRSTDTPPRAILEVVAPTTRYSVAGHPLGLAVTELHPTGYVSGHLGDKIAGSVLSMRAGPAASSGQTAQIHGIVATHRRMTKDQIADLVPISKRTAHDPVRHLIELAESLPLSNSESMQITWDLEQRQRRYILRDYQALLTMGPSFLLFADAAWADFWATVPLRWQVSTPLYTAALTPSFYGPHRGLADIPINADRRGPVRSPSFRKARVRTADISRRLRRKLGMSKGAEPTSSGWMHGLSSSRWADELHWLCGPGLARRIDSERWRVGDHRTDAMFTLAAAMRMVDGQPLEPAIIQDPREG